MISDKVLKAAIAAGEEQAERVISFRDQQLIKRSHVIATLPKQLTSTLSGEFQAKIAQLLGPKARGTLIAEGDSWFDYPFHDILRILEDYHGFDIDSAARRGDRVEDMAYSDGQLEELTRRIEKILRNDNNAPRAILLSGGGNDLAGEEFGMLLNHANSVIGGLNLNVVEGVIKERVKIAYVTILSKISRICQRRIGYSLPFIVHGYDYPIPDGRGFLGGWWLFPGPWLEPGFREKGFTKLEERTEIARKLMDYFNEMLQEVSSLSDFSHVKYVDLRGTVSVSKNYKDDWDNELHPTEEGFKRVARKFADVIDKLS